MNTSPLPPEDQSKYVLAFNQHRAEIEAVPEDKLVHMNLEVLPATSAVLVAIGRIRPMRDEFAKLPGFDITKFDKLEGYTMALAHAQTRCAWESKASDELTEQIAALQTTRELFVSDVEALAKRNLFSNDQLKRVRSNAGYRNVAYNVLELTAFLREHWSTIQGRCALTLAEIESASKLAATVAEGLAAREAAKAQQEPAVLLRDKAYTLFFRAHAQVRRGIEYLFFDDEAKGEDLFPSLFAGRGGRKPKPVEAPPEESQPATPAAPTTPLGAPVNAPPNVTPKPAASGGMPGGSPIT
ncbi:MAG: hypothetical protein U0414_07235 [Polyangiaceae bacterium]